MMLSSFDAFNKTWRKWWLSRETRMERQMETGNSNIVINSSSASDSGEHPSLTGLDDVGSSCTTSPSGSSALASYLHKASKPSMFASWGLILSLILRREGERSRMRKVC